MTSRKAEPGYIWRSRDIYGGVGIEFNGFGDSLGMKLAEPLKIPSLLYTKNILKIRLQNVPGGAVEPNKTSRTKVQLFLKTNKKQSFNQSELKFGENDKSKVELELYRWSRSQNIRF